MRQIDRLQITQGPKYGFKGKNNIAYKNYFDWPSFKSENYQILEEWRNYNYRITYDLKD